MHNFVSIRGHTNEDLYSCAYKQIMHIFYGILFILKRHKKTFYGPLCGIKVSINYDLIRDCLEKEKKLVFLIKISSCSPESVWQNS